MALDYGNGELRGREAGADVAYVTRVVSPCQTTGGGGVGQDWTVKREERPANIEYLYNNSTQNVAVEIDANTLSP